MTETNPIRLADLAADIGGTVIPGSADVGLRGVGMRGQDVRDGWLFAALPGARVHGADFCADAVSAGAVAVLTDEDGRERAAATGVPVLVHPDPRSVLGPVSARVFGAPSVRASVIGVTGTSGKTTTCHLVEAALRAAGRSVGLIGTTGSRLGGLPIETTLTTPEAPVLQQVFAMMADSGATEIVMEVSSHALSRRRVDGTRFEVGAFLNLSQDHLDFHDGMEDYFAAKARFFREDSPVRPRHSVVCVDDDWGRRMAGIARAGGGDVTTVSAIPGAAADWTVSEAAVGEDGGQSFEVTDASGTVTPVWLRLPGAYNVANALVALAIVDALGVPPAIAGPGLAGAVVPGRLERVDAGQDFLAVVDYAHKPAAVAAVLATLRRGLSGRLAVVLGAGGDRDAGKRPLMGAEAARLADLVVVTDDNPRSEDPAVIRAAVVGGAREAAGSGVEILEIGDRAEAIRAAVAWARPGDAVVIAGKGHETGQDVDGVVRPFDDRLALADAIRERGEGPESAGDERTMGPTGPREDEAQ